MSIKRKLQRNYKSKLTDNQAAGLHALDPRRLNHILPPQEAEYKAAEQMYDMCDDTRRRGAGGTKVGLPGIRPIGQAAADDFHRTFTSPEKEVEKQNFMDLHNAPGRYEGPPLTAIAFPENMCILCMRKDVQPGRPGCKEKLCKCCPMMDWMPILEDIGELKKGATVRSIYCPDCKILVKKEAKHGNESGILVQHEGNMVPAWTLKSAARFEKVWANIAYILRASRLEALNAGGFRTEGIGR